MSVIYPLISRYDIKLQNISLSNPRVSSTEKLETVTTGEGDDKKDIETLVKRNYTNYSINYLYDRIGANSLCIITQWAKIERKPYYNKITKDVVFGIDSTNYKFNSTIMSIIDTIKNSIMVAYPSMKVDDIRLPISGGVLYITLMSFRNRITTPIHYHRSKKQGYGSVTICNRIVDDTIADIKNNMTLFRSSSYGKQQENKDTGAILDLWYDCKTSLNFCVEMQETIITDDNRRKYCSIKVYAREMEIKYNSSYVKSVLDKDVVDIRKENTDGITSIIL